MALPMPSSLVGGGYIRPLHSFPCVAVLHGCLVLVLQVALALILVWASKWRSRADPQCRCTAFIGNNARIAGCGRRHVGKSYGEDRLNPWLWRRPSSSRFSASLPWSSGQRGRFSEALRCFAVSPLNAVLKRSAEVTREGELRVLLASQFPVFVAVGALIPVLPLQPGQVIRLF